MSNRIAYVTGGMGGIGTSICRRLHQAGFKVIAGCGPSRDHEKWIAEQKADGYTFYASVGNVADWASTVSAFEKVKAEHGNPDILVNNAGVSWGAPLDDFPEAGWDKVFDTNVKGVFFLTQKMLPLLEAKATNEDPSRVINIGSIDGIRTPMFDTHSYGPSKAALHSLTSQMAAKLVKRKILVNAIAPGPFPTWMLSTGVGGGGDVEGTDWDAVGRTNPRKRVGTPEDIAGLAIFLSSRAGAFTVGEVIKCDGGIVIS
jgi:2-deoxy-D-gluconate 3-dehydrogenase